MSIRKSIGNLSVCPILVVLFFSGGALARLPVGVSPGAWSKILISESSGNKIIGYLTGTPYGALKGLGYKEKQFLLEQAFDRDKNLSRKITDAYYVVSRQSGPWDEVVENLLVTLRDQNSNTSALKGIWKRITASPNRLSVPSDFSKYLQTNRLFERLAPSLDKYFNSEIRFLLDGRGNRGLEYLPPNDEGSYRISIAQMSLSIWINKRVGNGAFHYKEISADSRLQPIVFDVAKTDLFRIKNKRGIYGIGPVSIPPSKIKELKNQTMALLRKEVESGADLQSPGLGRITFLVVLEHAYDNDLELGGFGAIEGRMSNVTYGEGFPESLDDYGARFSVVPPKSMALYAEESRVERVPIFMEFLGLEYK